MRGPILAADMPVPKKSTFALRAEGLFQSGRKLEKARKLTSARTVDETVIRDFPDTDQAKAAEARLKVINGK